ncbi:DUF6095 family protein [Flavobacterium litorale]|nr:DUF6095 family protein [Flavobacterium litorale]
MKGLSFMAWAIPLFFVGPTIIHSSFKNQGHPLYIPVLGLGIIFCLLGMLMFARGIKTIMKSMFG